MSQVFNSPSVLLEMATPALALRLIDETKGRVVEVDSGLTTPGSTDERPICQNLTDLSKDVEIREEEEENTREEVS